jgi:hypothetical protein
MNRTLTIIIAGLMVLSGLAIASGAPGGAATDVLGSDRGTGTASGTANLTGGNVTQVNISGTQITGRWGGFYGEIEGGLQLSDSGSNLFYEWTVSDYTGSVVFAATGTVSNWTAVAAGAVGDQPAYLQVVAADNFTNTFASTEAFNSSSLNIPDVPFVETFDSTNSSAWKTYALSADGENLYAALAVDGGDGFDGSAIDYQLLAPADSGLTSYSFYLELP